MRFQVNFLLRLKLEEITCYFGLLPISLQDFLLLAFYFLLHVLLAKLNTGGPLLHCTCYFLTSS